MTVFKSLLLKAIVLACLQNDDKCHKSKHTKKGYLPSSTN